jgi:localization factor PodJL
MNSGFPGQAQDERQRAWEAAQEAARRAGMSVNEWLDTTLIDSEMRNPIEPTAAPRPTNPEYNQRTRRAPQEDLSGVRSRLDMLGRQLEDLARANAAKGPQAAPPAPQSAPVRQQELPMRRPRPPSGNPATPLEQALLEIAERQQALDGEAQPRPELPRAHSQDVHELEQQLRQITHRVEAMRPCAMDGLIESIRNELAEMGALLKEAMPRQALEALETEVRGLAARIDTKRDAGVDDHAIANLERGLAEMRDVLRSLTPAENLAGLELAVNGLTQRIDLVGGAHDPAALEQLESAIVGLRAIVSHVASSEALEKLSEVVRELAAKVDQLASSDVLAMLEQRITTIADALQSRHQQNEQEARDVDAVFHGLTDKLEQLQLTPGDQTAVHHLEDRIAALVEKLDASDARLGHLEAIERGLAELLIHIEHQRLPNAMRGAAEAPEFDTIKREVQRNQDALEAVHGTLGHLVDRLSIIETNFRGGPSTPAPAAASAATFEPPAPRPAAPVMPAPAIEQTRRPIDPDLPPDHPLEPGSAGARQAMSPAERIAASEAALGSAKPPVIPDPGGKSNFIAAARRAARAASSEAALRREKGPAIAAESEAPSRAAGGPSRRLRSLLVGASVVLLVLGSLQIAYLFFSGGDSESSAPERTTQSIPDARALPETAPKAPPAGRQSALLPAPSTSPFTGLPAISVPGMPATQPTGPALSQSTQSVSADHAVTGSIKPPETPIPVAPLVQPSSADKLPAAIGGSALRAAAVKGDAAAEFEIAVRLADGRGVPQDWTAASEWFERAAKKGLIPAQFRLAGLYEKGLGVKKDVEAARRLYLSAAEAGHAKAMHNLAVLYAEGAEGKPDYQTSAKWFRKAASYGIADSQYNLAILYARGIGVEVNMTEAYKWFSLAAREGDADAAKKRDEIGSRLDQQALMTARAAVQVWTAEPQPEAATQVKAPAGGWDAVATPKSSSRRTGSGAT